MSAHDNQRNPELLATTVEIRGGLFVENVVLCCVWYKELFRINWVKWFHATHYRHRPRLLDKQGLPIAIATRENGYNKACQLHS
jgi:hypothetical protein